ncbi:MAG: N-methyl-L-tryptophan oxidase [Planctomycetota bacterium]
MRKTRPERCEVCVLGVGGIGSAVLAELSRRGVSAVGIDQFDRAHDQGSSHGETRIIRKAYFEHPGYVPLLERSYEAWADLEAWAGEPLLRTTGLLIAGAPGGETMAGLERCYREHDLAHERLGADAVAERFSGLSLDPEMEALYDPFGGVLFVERCILANLRRAEEGGAKVLTGERVQRWESDSRGIYVVTNKRHVLAEKLIVTAGAWARRMLAGIVPLEVERKVLLWYDPPNAADYGPERLPAYYIESQGGAGSCYGFPNVGGEGLKIAQHMPAGGLTVPSPFAVPGPEDLDRSLLDTDEQPVLEFARRHIVPLREAGGAGCPRLKHSVCMYTSTPDGQFVLDRHPSEEGVVIGTGFSGHGFKLAPAVAEVLCDLALAGRSEHDVGFLSLRRFDS